MKELFHKDTLKLLKDFWTPSVFTVLEHIKTLNKRVNEFKFTVMYTYFQKSINFDL